MFTCLVVVDVTKSRRLNVGTAVDKKQHFTNESSKACPKKHFLVWHKFCEGGGGVIFALFVLCTSAVFAQSNGVTIDADGTVTSLADGDPAVTSTGNITNLTVVGDGLDWRKDDSSEYKDFINAAPFTIDTANASAYGQIWNEGTINTANAFGNGWIDNYGTITTANVFDSGNISNYGTITTANASDGGNIYNDGTITTANASDGGNIYNNGTITTANASGGGTIYNYASLGTARISSGGVLYWYSGTIGESLTFGKGGFFRYVGSSQPLEVANGANVDLTNANVQNDISYEGQNPTPDYLQAGSKGNINTFVNNFFNITPGGTVTGKDGIASVGYRIYDVNVLFDIAANGDLSLSSKPVWNMQDGNVAAAYLHQYNTVYRAANNRVSNYLQRNLTRQNFNNFNDGSTYRGQCDPCSPVCNPCDAVCNTQKFGGRQAWVNYVARGGELESSYLDYAGRTIKNSSNGVQFGVDLLTANNAVLGVMFGYEDHRSRIAADITEAEDYYFGLYGGKLFRNGVDVRGFFGYGSQDYNISRVTSIGEFGNLPAKSNPNGDTYELNFEIGRRTYLNNRLSFRPFFGVDYSQNAIGATDESAWYEYGGFDVPTFHYGKVNLEQVFLRVGTDLRYQRGRFGWYGNFAYSGNIGDDYASANVNAIADGGYDWTPMHGYTGELRSVKYGNSIFTLGTGTNFALTKNWSVNIDYNADIYTDGKAKTVHTGFVGTTIKF